MTDLEFEKLIKNADALIQAGKWEEALSFYKQALEIDQENINIRRNIINICFKINDYSFLVDEYIKLIQIFRHKGDIEQAIKTAQEVLALDMQAEKRLQGLGRKTFSTLLPQIKEIVKKVSPDIFYFLGILYFEKSDLDESINFLQKSLEMNPNNVDAHILLGQIFMEKKLDKEAQGEFQEVIRLDPQNAALAYEMLGEIFVKLGKDSQNNLVWHKNAADIYLKKNQFKDAIRSLEKILDFDPKNQEILFNLGEVYSKSGDTSSSLRVYEELANIYKEEGQYDKSINLYEKLLERDSENKILRGKLEVIYNDILNLDPSNLSVRHKLIGNLLRSGEAKAAIPHFLALAESYLNKEMLDEALSVCHKILELDPHQFSAREVLGEIYFQTGKLDLARNEFLEAMKLLREAGEEEHLEKLNKRLSEIFPKESEIHYQLALSHFEKDNLEEAEEELNLILKDNPKYLQALKLIAKIYLKKDRKIEILNIYQRILQINPEETQTRADLIKYYLSLGRLEDAIKESIYLADIFDKTGEIKEAEKLYKSVLSFYPNQIEVYLSLSNLYFSKGELEKAKFEYLFLLNYFIKKELFYKAIDICNKLLEISPIDLNIHYKLGRLNKQVSLIPEAIKNFSFLIDELFNKNLEESAFRVILELLEFAPDVYVYREKLINFLIKQSRLQEVEEHYKILIDNLLKEGNSSYARIHTDKALSLKLSDSFKYTISQIYLSRNYYPEALKLSEDLLGDYKAKGLKEEILQIYQQIQKIYLILDLEKYWEVSEVIADLYKEEEKWEEALNQYRNLIEDLLKENNLHDTPKIILKFLDIKDKNASQLAEKLLLNLANNLKEEKEKSLIIYNTLEQFYEQNLQFHKAVSTLEIIARFYQEGKINLLEVFDKKIAVYLKSKEIKKAIFELFEKIKVLLELKNAEAVEVDFEKISNLSENKLETDFKMAEIYFDLDFLDQALPLYQKIIKIDPSNLEAMAKLALIYIKKGELTQGSNLIKKLLNIGKIFDVMDEYKKVLSKTKSISLIHFKLGSLYKELGFMEEALWEFFQASLENDLKLKSLEQIALYFKEEKLISLAEKQFYQILGVKGFKDEDYQESRYSLGLLLEETGKLKEALDIFYECYAVDIKYKDVAERIKRLSEILK